jgi:hypothetical protein
VSPSGYYFLGIGFSMPEFKGVLFNARVDVENPSISEFTKDLIKYVYALDVNCIWLENKDLRKYKWLEEHMPNDYEFKPKNGFYPIIKITKTDIYNSLPSEIRAKLVEIMRKFAVLNEKQRQRWEICDLFGDPSLTKDQKKQIHDTWKEMHGVSGKL